MDRRSQPIFVRQPISKAVPIINPDSVDVLTVPEQRLPGGIPQPLQPALRGVQPPLLANTGGSFGSGTQRDYPVDGSGHGHDFNVYARPFVPESFAIINELEGREFDTPGIKQIDFGTYVGRCIGWGFLPPIPIPIDLPMHESFRLADDVIHTHYEAYFRYHIAAEIQSQKQENESYSLFGHEITTISRSKTGTTCSFLVPGLRENSPYVEEDDIVQLRQLVYDQLGRLFRMEQWLSPPSLFNRGGFGYEAPGGRWRGERAPGWTGIIYNARILAVQRRENRLVVRVDGLLPDLPYSPAPVGGLKFNIQFPIANNRYLPMRHVLPIVQEVFRHAKRTISPDSKTYEVIHLAQPNSSTTPSSSSEPLGQETLPQTPWLQSMLFPTEVDCDIQKMLNPGTFHRKHLDQQLNWEQKKAIGSICSHDYGTLPFLISGPPGTGKTKTLVEVALQLLKTVDEVSHVLFCAPSDPAADMIVQRISSHFASTELLRLNRSSRTFAEVPGGVLPFCCISQDRFDLPTFRQLMACKLVVTTCRDASLLLHSRVMNADLYAAEHGLLTSMYPEAPQPSEVKLHWTALLIDEAAQAMEPEALIPIAVVAPPLGVKIAFKPLVIMAGDEHQLGPRTSLPSSSLKTSLFARLFSRPVYADHPLARSKTGKPPQVLNRTMLPIHRPAFANLIRNYRSHPAILAVPSALFYADTLEPEAPDIDRLDSWPEWRGRGWPVLFRHNDSEDETEIESGGWYNAGEAQLACWYASRLVQSKLVAQNEVCIMSPFKAQVACLRNTIKEKRFGSLWDIDIGPTEAFQGLERGVVILCTTRSKQRFVESDKKANWGIIGFPNKMNVAITRAKFGLIVIGKREILLSDPNWKSFLDFCNRNGLVADEHGVDRSLHDRDNMEPTRLEKVLLAQEQEFSDSHALKVVSQEDEMWTGGMQAALDAANYGGSEYSNEGEDGEIVV